MIMIFRLFLWRLNGFINNPVLFVSIPTVMPGFYYVDNCYYEAEVMELCLYVIHTLCLLLLSSLVRQLWERIKTKVFLKNPVYSGAAAWLNLMTGLRCNINSPNQSKYDGVHWVFFKNMSAIMPLPV